MPILAILLVLAAIGFAVWLFHKFAAPYIAEPFLKIIDVVALAGTIWWLLKITGIWDYLWSLRL